MKKIKKEVVEYIVVGSNFRISETEAGAGKTRFGIKLDIATRLFVDNVNLYVDDDEGGAKEVAEKAFEATEIFLQELDKHFLTKPEPDPATNTNNNRK